MNFAVYTNIVVTQNKPIDNASCYFAHGRAAKYCNQRVCLSVCLSARISHFQISPNYLRMLPVAVARFFSDDNAIPDEFPVLWMMLCFI